MTRQAPTSLSATDGLGPIAHSFGETGDKGDKGKVDDRIFETRGQILLQELEDLYNN